MPYIIGVHSSLIKVVLSMPLEDIVFLDVDADTITSPFNDNDQLPLELVATLRACIKSFRNDQSSNGLASGFLEFFTSLFGTLRPYFRQSSAEGRMIFDTDTFVLERPKPLHPCVQVVARTQQFQQMVEQKASKLAAGIPLNGIYERALVGIF